QEKLSQEQIKLEAYEANLTNLKDMQDVNEALALISQVNQQFEPTRLNVEQQNLEQQALAELTLGTEGQLEMEIDPTQSVDAIAERLQQLKSRPASGPPE
ncbi:MAG: PspA/IM30 family protein, partial [Oscillatoriales cyanobacterium SM2_3_0]|nr:PspA/IM30 family protein [Oscillatoriales cyanobacterium SM2_3_0]